MRNPFSRDNPNDQFTGPNPFSMPLTHTANAFTEPAQAQQPDPRVAQALTLEGLEYVTYDSGNYGVTLKFSEDGRTQLVIIRSKTGEWRGEQWRKLWSKAFQVKGQISGKQAIELLKDADDRLLGGWCIEEDEGMTRVYYQMSVPADASPAALHHAMSYVAGVADNMEKKVLGTDEF